MKYKPLVIAGIVGAGLGFLVRPSIEDIVNRFQTEEIPPIVMFSEKSRFSKEKRETMFDEGVGLPHRVRVSDYWIEYWKGDTELNFEKNAYVSVCLNGRYSQEIHKGFINPDEANVLLMSYGWK